MTESGWCWTWDGSRSIQSSPTTSLAQKEQLGELCKEVCVWYWARISLILGGNDESSVNDVNKRFSNSCDEFELAKGKLYSSKRVWRVIKTWDITGLRHRYPLYWEE